MKNTILISLAALFVTAGSAVAKDLFVPSEYETIQAAIDDANDGDTVVVADGTYTGQGNRDIEFKGKAISVMSETGPEKCIIDCQGSESEPHRGFYFYSSEDSNSVVDGFTITNGFDKYYSGGIYCRKSSPKIVNCIITRCRTECGGAGIYCKDASPLIASCLIADNHAAASGGAVLFQRSSAKLIGSVLTVNSTGSDGGAIACNASSPTITACIISGNLSRQDGGGIACKEQSRPTLSACIISGNLATNSGGAVYCNKSSPTITGCTISANFARAGGSVCYHSGSSPVISNSILWRNDPQKISSRSDTPQIAYCNVEGGWQGEGIIDVDPLFIMDGPDSIKGTWTSHPVYDPNTNRTTLNDTNASFTEEQLVGYLIQLSSSHTKQAYITANTSTAIMLIGDQRPYTAKGDMYRLVDYYLQPGSPCIDAGTAESAPATDIQGRTRDAKPDIGAYE